MYRILSVQVAFCRQVWHSERLSWISSTCIAFWATRQHFVDRCRILSTEAAFCRQVSHSERLGSISSTCIAFWAPRQRFVERCRILTAWVMFLQQVFRWQMQFCQPLSHFVRPGTVSCRRRLDFLDRCRIFCTSVFGRFSTIFLGDLINLASLKGWVSF